MRLAISVLVFALAGCASVEPVHYDRRDVSKQDQSVRLLIGGDNVITAIDDRPLPDPMTTWNGGYDAVDEVRTTPGTHTVHGKASRRGYNSPFSIRQDFAANAEYALISRIEGYRVVSFIERNPPSDEEIARRPRRAPLPVVADGEPARLTVDDGLILHSIDGLGAGYRSAEGEAQAFDLKPGKHTLNVAVNTNTRFPSGATVWFVPEAGKRYRLAHDGGAFRYSVYVIDVDTGRQTGGILGSDDEPL